MKTAIIQPTETLRQLVLYTRQLSDSIEVQSFDEIVKDKKIDVILTEQGDLTASDIIQIRNKLERQKIAILVDNIEPFFQKSCITHDVLILSKQWSQREQLNMIQKVWFGLEEQTEYHNVIAFHGTHRQAGVTQTALSVGHVLGTFNYKTCVVGLNPYNPGQVTGKKTTYSFDQIYDLIQTNVIRDGETLEPYLEKFEHFYYLLGNRDFYRAMTFEQKPVEQLIHFLKAHFDIVILDLGSFYDSFLALTGLKLSNTHVLISTQEQISLDEYKRWKDQILNRFEFHPKSNFQIVNKYASQAILTLKQLEEKHQLPILTQVPYFPEANDAEIEDGILALSDYNPYTKVIEGIARVISIEVLSTDSNKVVGKKFLGLFGGRRKAK